MQIDRIIFPTETLGYGKRISIWTIGCAHHCYHCSNPELWMENPDRDISIGTIIKIIKQFADKCDGITITGGDPYYQVTELVELLTEIKTFYLGDVLIYTGFTLEKLKNGQSIYQVALAHIDILIDGLYIDDLNDNTGIRGSSNQVIYRLNPAFEYRYVNCESWIRKSQIVESNQFLYSVGIPHKTI